MWSVWARLYLITIFAIFESDSLPPVIYKEQQRLLKVVPPSSSNEQEGILLSNPLPLHIFEKGIFKWKNVKKDYAKNNFWDLISVSSPISFFTHNFDSCHNQIIVC